MRTNAAQRGSPADRADLRNFCASSTVHQRRLWVGAGSRPAEYRERQHDCGQTALRGSIGRSRSNGACSRLRGILCLSAAWADLRQLVQPRPDVPDLDFVQPFRPEVRHDVQPREVVGGGQRDIRGASTAARTGRQRPDLLGRAGTGLDLEPGRGLAVRIGKAHLGLRVHELPI